MLSDGSGGQRGFPALVTWKTGFLIVLCLFLVVSLLYAAEEIPGTHPVLRRIIESVAAIILTSGIISIASNLLVHKQLADFWLDALGVKESLQAAGLRQIGLDFHAFDFRKYILVTTHIDICVIYASAWLRNHINDLKDFLSKPGAEIRICLLDESSNCLPSFAESFGMKEAELRSKINDSIELFKSTVEELRKVGNLKGRLQIFKHNRPPRHTYYRFDDTLMLVPYNIARGRPRIPVFSFQRQQGGVSDFLVEDFESVLREHAKPAFDSNGPNASHGTRA